MVVEKEEMIAANPLKKLFRQLSLLAFEFEFGFEFEFVFPLIV